MTEMADPKPCAICGKPVIAPLNNPAFHDRKSGLPVHPGECLNTWYWNQHPQGIPKGLKRNEPWTGARWLWRGKECMITAILSPQHCRRRRRQPTVIVEWLEPNVERRTWVHPAQFFREARKTHDPHPKWRLRHAWLTYKQRGQLMNLK